MSISEPTPAIESPVGARWRLVLLLSAMVAVAHFNRISISVVGAEFIIPKKGVPTTEMGLVYTAYLFTYTLAMSPGGWLNDRYGPRLGLFVVGVGSAIFVTLTGLVGASFTGGLLVLLLILMRGLMGIANAPTHPGAARLVGNWAPLGQRSFINGLVCFAACVGAAATYPLLGGLMDRFGLLEASALTGTATLSLALMWGLFARNRPVALTAAAPLDIARRDIPWHFLLRNRSLVLLTLSYAAVNYFEDMIFYWAGYYFKDVRGMSKADGRLFAMFLTLAMGFGMIAGGWLTDWTRLQLAHRRTIALVPVAGLLLSALAILPGLASDDIAVTLYYLAVATAAVGACEGAFWTLAVELGGSRGALAAGILNTGGNVGGFIAPVLTPFISAELGWHAGFGVASVVCILGALCWLGIDPHDRVEKEIDAATDR